MAAEHVVVDPSVVIKWYVPEEQAVLAADFKQWLLTGTHRVIVPSLFYDEITNILWKKEFLRKELVPRATKEILWEILRLPWQVYSDRHEMLPKAIEIAREALVSAYDAMYVATAIQNQAVFVTADARLTNRLASTSFARSVLSLEDWKALVKPEKKDRP